MRESVTTSGFGPTDPGLDLKPIALFSGQHRSLATASGQVRAVSRRLSVGIGYASFTMTGPMDLSGAGGGGGWDVAEYFCYEQFSAYIPSEGIGHNKQ
jgi:hypothetical protein